MIHMKDIRLAPKLISAFTLVALLAVGVGATGLAGLNSLNGNVGHLANMSVPNLTYLLQTQSAVHEATEDTRGNVMTSSASLTRAYVAASRHARALAWQAWQHYLALPFYGQRDTGLAQATTPLLRQWMQLDARVEQKGLQNTAQSNAAGVALSEGTEREAAARLDTAIQPLIAINQQGVTAAVGQAGSTYTAARNLLLAMALAALLLAVLLGISSRAPSPDPSPRCSEPRRTQQTLGWCKSPTPSALWQTVT